MRYCAYWCSDEFKIKRKRGQTSRSSNEDIAQNRGGSRPFTETQQVLEAKFGPQKATPINTFGAMKSGLKSMDSNGRCGPINSRTAQKCIVCICYLVMKIEVTTLLLSRNFRILHWHVLAIYTSIEHVSLFLSLYDDYIAAVKRIECQNEEDGDGADMEVDGLEVEEQQYLNEKALYDVSSGGPRKHGRLAIANGTVKSSDVRAAGRENSVRPSNSVTMQNMSREVEQLCRENGRLEQENREKDNALQQNKVLVDLVLNLYQDIGRVVPEEALHRLTATQAIATGSSHAASECGNNGNDVCHTNGDLLAANVDNSQGSDNDLLATNVGNNQGSDNPRDHASL